MPGPCIRLRADIVSTLPVDVYRYENGIQVQAPGMQILESIGGERVSFEEWRYSSQVELDRSGNSIGLIKDWDAKTNYPTYIQLQPTSLCSVLVDNDTNELTGYRIRGKTYSIDEVWHEKQYTVSGLHVGLSPVAYAAWTLGNYQSVQEFAYAWFGTAGTPRVMLKNTEKKLQSKDIALAQETWRATQSLGEPFVTGSDWEMNFITAQQASSDWIEAQRLNALDISRFFGVPASMIDAVLNGQNNTYANQESKNLEFLTLYLSPVLVRRERALSRLLPRPRFVKFNADALLRLDPKSRGELLKTQLESHQVTPTEARALENRAPFTEDQVNESLMFFPPKQSAVAA